MRLMDQSDRTLIQRWQREADGDAFTELVRRHARMVFAAADRILRNEADAEEVVQDSFVKVGTLQRFRGDSMGGLLHTIATHLAMNRLKSESRRREREIAYATSMHASGDADWTAIASHVDEAIASLPDAQREAIVRHYLEAQSYRAIADSKRVDESTVRHHARQGLVRIRRFLHRRGITASVSALAAGLAVEAHAGTLPVALVSALGKQAIAGPAYAVPAAGTLVIGGTTLMLKKAAMTLGVIALASAGVTTAVLINANEDAPPMSTVNDVVAERATETPPIVQPLPIALQPSNETAQTVPVEPEPNDVPESSGGGGLVDGIVFRQDEPDGIEPLRAADVPIENGMHHLLLASERFADLEMSDEEWEALYVKVMAGDTLTDVERAQYEHLQEVFDLVRQGVAMGNATMPYGADGPLTELPFLSRWRQIARVMNIESAELLKYGDYTRALDNYAIVTMFGAEIGHGGPLISSLVGMAVSGLGGDALLDTMIDGEMTASEYRQVLALVHDVQSRSLSAWEVLDNERIMMDEWYDAGGKNGSVIRALLDIADESEGTEEYARIAELKAMTDQQLEAQFLATRDELVRLTSYTTLPYYELAPIQKAIESEDSVLGQVFSPSVFATAAAFARLDVQMQGVAAVAAIELYRSERGAYPSAIEDLTPAYLPQVPADAYTGNSLIYRPQAGGYRLYSAGADMVDDGGLVHSLSRTAKGADFLLRR